MRNSKMKRTLITIVGLILLAAGLIILKTVSEPEGIMRTLPYLCVGIGCGLFGHGLGDIINGSARKKDPEMAKQMDIALKDERNISHGNAAKAKGFDMMTFVFAALMISYALMEAPLGIVISFVIAYVFVEIYAIYQRIKLDKED